MCTPFQRLAWLAFSFGGPAVLGTGNRELGSHVALLRHEQVQQQDTGGIDGAIALQVDAAPAGPTDLQAGANHWFTWTRDEIHKLSGVGRDWQVQLGADLTALRSVDHSNLDDEDAKYVAAIQEEMRTQLGTVFPLDTGTDVDLRQRERSPMPEAELRGEAGMVIAREADRYRSPGSTHGAHDARGGTSGAVARGTPASAEDYLELMLGEPVPHHDAAALKQEVTQQENMSSPQPAEIPAVREGPALSAADPSSNMTEVAHESAALPAMSSEVKVASSQRFVRSAAVSTMSWIIIIVGFFVAVRSRQKLGVLVEHLSLLPAGRQQEEPRRVAAPPDSSPSSVSTASVEQDLFQPAPPVLSPVPAKNDS